MVTRDSLSGLKPHPITSYIKIIMGNIDSFMICDK